LGSVIYPFGGFSFACNLTGIILLSYVPLLLLVVGKNNMHAVNKDKIDILRFALKPVTYS
jgi:hypothetical protein